MQECQQDTTSFEFVEWMLFYEREEWEVHQKTDYMLAQVCAEIRRFSCMFGGQPLPVEKFLPKFTREAPATPLPTNLTPEQDKELRAKAAATAKAMWSGIIGADLEDIQGADPA